MSSEVGLGRHYSRDERDNKFLTARYLLNRKFPRIRAHRYWNSNRWWGDQGGTSQCVVYSWAHCIERPNTAITPWRSEGGHELSWGSWRFTGQQPLINLDKAYNWAQRNDEWPGTDYDGTSVRAGAKYLHKHGHIESYTWAYDVYTVVHAVNTVSPVVAGTLWTIDMFVPDKHGFIEPTGDSVGGHAYLIDGVSNRNKFFRIKNSWGKNWGRGGFARITFDNFDKLLLAHGEACLPIFKAT